MKPVFFSLITLFFFCSLQAEKKDWYYGTGLDGASKEFFGTRDMHSRFLATPPRGLTYWETKLSKVNSQLESSADKIKNASEGPERNLLVDDRYKLINNKARCLIYLNKTDEALKILIELENAWPGESIVAENIATCYDLKGDYSKAVQWIETSTDRNQMANYSNLWVYKNIVTARNEFAKDKNYFLKNSVTGLTISQDLELKALDLSKIENFQKRWSLAGRAKHIREQLKTQLQLRGGEKDPVLAHLMEELACIYAVNEVCEVALPIFELAKKYGHPEDSLISSRIEQMNSIIASNPASMSYSRSLFEKLRKTTWVLYSAIVFFLLLITYAWFTGKKRSVELPGNDTNP